MTYQEWYEKIPFETTGVVAPGCLFEQSEGLKRQDMVQECGIVDAIFNLFGAEAANAYVKVYCGSETATACALMNESRASWGTLRSFGEWWRKEKGL